MNRRHFLQATGTAALALSAFPQYAAEFADARKRVGLIGTGWYGKIDLFRLIQVAPVEVVSLCDVDKRMLSDAADMVAERQVSKKRPRTYGDYREMLKEKDLDVVLIATPDHWHALPMIEACKAGADIYCQKPVGVDVVECQAMLAAARKYNRVVQIGTQRRSTPHHHRGERRRSSSRALLGKVGHGRDLLLLPHAEPRQADNRAGRRAPRDNLDYEMWTGPAPMRPVQSSSSTRAAGGPSWSTATGSSATCASTCST